MTVKSYGGTGKQYCTPEALLKPVYEFAGAAGIAMDPCSHPDSIVKARKHVMLPKYEGTFDVAEFESRNGGTVVFDDGFDIVWPTGEITFVNPPFSDVRGFVSKALTERNRGCEVLMLTNASLDTAWYQGLVHSCADVKAVLRGRKAFRGAKHTNPHPHLYHLYSKNQFSCSHLKMIFDPLRGHGVVL